ncbi:putative sodium-coupled neutral amino acid transporter 11 isoform X1 [Zalophus californianus]|uniref:Putative sodium-coupled neutral amino acid transporter 11 n=1 Tax=Zalophus californianus TaxID=9704 RepID=A0A6J2CRG9_ZALCA|nr:putative sodium-coupled neutral amino acid transporter 11 isoform X1 [Zalophus californianus]XP_027977157.1 putative sodium-coupled neutral amino acid transporter 11 [Eumetopias jubatus]
MGYQAQGPVIPPQSNLDDRETLVSEHKHKGKTYRQFTAVFNVVNSIIGSGIIGLPYSMKQAGFPLGILLLFGVSYITDFSLVLLIKGGALSGTDTYQSLVNKTFGFPGYLLLSVLQFFYPFIAMISYNIITGDTLSKVFQRIPGVDPENLLIGRHFIIMLSTAAFTLPLSLYRDIAKLGKISFLSTVLTALILGIVMTRVVSLGPYIPKTEDAWVFAKPNAIQALGVMSFAFICHHNCFLVYGSLEDPTVANWSRIIHVSTLASVLTSTLFATCGYLTFTGFTQGDLFENYCRNDDLVTFGRFCYGVTVILTYPIECFVTREVIANVFFGGNLSSVLHIIVTVVIITVAMFTSLLIDCLGKVLELNGVLCAAPLIFIIPSACYLKLSEEPRTHSDKIMSCIMLPVGVMVMVAGLVMAIANPQDCTHGREMFYCFADNLSLTNISVSHFQLTTQLSVLNSSTFQ